MRKQYAVFGLGNFGKHLALGLENLGCEVIVVDNSMEKIQEIADKVSYAMCANIEDGSDKITGSKKFGWRSDCNL